MGKNGRGKTHLLHAIAGLLPVQQGSIRLNGVPITHYSPKQRAHYLGLLPQENNSIFPLTVMETLQAARYPYRKLYAPHEHQQIIEQALLRFDLHAIKNHPLTLLSGGERQRVHLAAVVAQQPAIYLLDEPLNHLDISYQLKTLMQFYDFAKHQGALVIMILHDLHAIQKYCDRIIFLVNQEQHQLMNTAEYSFSELERLFVH